MTRQNSRPTRWVPRREWAELPGSLVEEVERRLGAVGGFEPRQGGFSDGVLGVVTLDGGRRAFLKALPAGTGDHLTEAAVAAALPHAVPAPRLLFSYERDGWALLCPAPRRAS